MDLDYDKAILVLAAQLGKFPQEVRAACESGLLDFPDAKGLLQIGLSTPFIGEGFSAFLKSNPGLERKRRRIMEQIRQLDLKLRIETDPEKRWEIAQQMNRINTWEAD